MIQPRSTPCVHGDSVISSTETLEIGLMNTEYGCSKDIFGFSRWGEIYTSLLPNSVVMADEMFTEPEDTTDGWVDVRMTNPEEGEWDVDFVVVDGQVNYVDLRIRPELLNSFVECLIDDIGEDRASRMLAEMAERKNIDPPTRPEED